MSVNLLNFNEVSYKGLMQPRPVSACRPVKQTKMALTTFDWRDYELSTVNPVAVPVNFIAGVIPTIEFIQGIYIDNTVNGVTVSVLFPDTGFVVQVGPNSALFAPVYTNELRAFVCAESAFVITNSAVTKIFFCNTNVSPFVSTKLPDPLPGLNVNEGLFDLTAPLPYEQTIAGTNIATFIYWSSFYAWAFGEQSLAPTTVVIQVAAQDNLFDALFTLRWSVNGYATGRGQCIFSQSGMGFLTLASAPIVLRRLSAPLLAGSMEWNATYTDRPA